MTDRDGRFVSDLRAEDFTVAENGRAQTVSYFASVEQPFSVFFLLDTSGSNRFRLEDMQEAAVRFVEQLRPLDRVLPVAFDNEAVALLGGWSGDRAALAAAIRSSRTGMFMGPKDIETIRDSSGKTVTVRHVNTRLYDAVHKAIAELRKVRGRKALILFTDGLDTDSTHATYGSTLEEAEELDALIYVVQYAGSVRAVEGPQGPPASARARLDVMQMPPGVVARPSHVPPAALHALKRADDYLEGLAERTGGRLYRAGDLGRIGESFAAIAEELRRMYSIGYSPTPLARPGERREVKIKVRRERLSVRARRAYVFRPL